MSDIKYSIQFFSPWHCGSGLSAGADVDELVIKDANGMPYIPGKTLKGLIREAFEDYAGLSSNEMEQQIREAFGVESDADNTEKNVSGSAYFSNASLEKAEYDAIIASGSQQYLYNRVASTALDENGIAIDHSLRAIETTVPCRLYAWIQDLPDGLEEMLGKSLGLIHHIGMDRNRGLGRCDLNIETGGKV